MIRHVQVPIVRLPGNEDIPLPSYQSADSAAMDLHAAVADPVQIPPGESALIGCGFAVAIPNGFEGQVRPRSGLAAKHSLLIPNSPGTIDADYRGEVKVILLNLGKMPFVVTRTMRIAQLLIVPVPYVDWVEQPSLPPTMRASGGFGHTGE